MLLALRTPALRVVPGMGCMQARLWCHTGLRNHVVLLGLGAACFVSFIPAPQLRKLGWC